MADEGLDATIDREARDDRERAASRLLLKELSARRGELGGAAAIPAEDGPLSERILREARTRSAEIRRSNSGVAPSTRMPAAGRSVPWWLVAAWVGALGAAALAWYLLF
jgi:hypothetical protein